MAARHSHHGGLRRFPVAHNPLQRICTLSRLVPRLLIAFLIADQLSNVDEGRQKINKTLVSPGGRTRDMSPLLLITWWSLLL